MMATKFDTIPLSETTKFIVDNRGKTAPTAETGIALIATNCITNESLYPQYINVRRVSQETYETWFRAHPKPGDIILTNKGSKNGAICLVPDTVDFVIAQDMMALRANEEVIDPLYLFAALRSPMAQWQIRNLDVSGVIPHFKKTDFDKLHLPYPDMPTQRAIGKLYFDFCAKIELNRRMNATLESLARAIFKSWFVDFDPVRMKSEGGMVKSESSDSAPSPFTLPPSLFHLFPSSFQDSELGKIPTGWETCVLDDLTEFVIGGDWGKDSPEDPFTEEVKCIRGADIPDLQNGGVGRMPTRFIKANSLKQRGMRPGDIAFEISGGSPTQSTGRPVLATRAILDRLPTPLTCSNFCRLIRLKNQVSPMYVYSALRSLYDRDEFLQYENGTTGIKNLAFKIFSGSHAMLSPPANVMDEFEKIVSSLYAKHASNGLESSTLSTLRDTLLPKLLSGELPVPAALTATQDVLNNA